MSIFNTLLNAGGQITKGVGEAAIDIGGAGVKLFGGVFKSLFKALAADDPIANSMIDGVAHTSDAGVDAVGNVGKKAVGAGVDLATGTASELASNLGRFARPDFKAPPPESHDGPTLA